MDRSVSSILLHTLSISKAEKQMNEALSVLAISLARWSSASSCRTLISFREAKYNFGMYLKHAWIRQKSRKKSKCPTKIKNHKSLHEERVIRRLLIFLCEFFPSLYLYHKIPQHRKWKVPIYILKKNNSVPRRYRARGNALKQRSPTFLAPGTSTLLWPRGWGPLP